MKNPLSTLLLLLATLSVSAFADDWKGRFLGLNLGFADPSVEVEDSDFENDPDGPPLVGGSIGWNYGLLGKAEGNRGFRWGSQFDLAFGDYSESKVNDPDLGDVEVDGVFHGMARARIGYSWDRTWIYATAGLAASDFMVQAADGDDTTIVVTGVGGIGAEYRINDRWGLQAELLSTGEAEPDEKFGGVERKVKVNQNQLRLGATWRF